MTSPRMLRGEYLSFIVRDHVAGTPNRADSAAVKAFIELGA